RRSRGLKLLKSEKSTLWALEARTASSVRPRFPNVYGAAALKAAVLNHLLTDWALPRLTGWPFRLGHCKPPKQKPTRSSCRGQAYSHGDDRVHLPSAYSGLNELVCVGQHVAASDR